VDEAPARPLCYRAAVVQRASVSLILATALAALTSLPSCAAPLEDGRACSAATAATAACEQGRSCVAGRCRAAESPPSLPDAQRVVLPPAALAVVGAFGPEGGDEVPSAVTLGRDAGGTVVMLFRFAATWRDDAEVVSAFLVLDALDGSPPATSPVTLETARVEEAWEQASVSWGRQPRLSVPRAAGAVRMRAPAPLRVDVTALVRAWSRRDKDDHGIALLARGGDAYGTVVSTGVSQGVGPRLEVYVK
jgi:hypothetical protein